MRAIPSPLMCSVHGRTDSFAESVHDHHDGVISIRFGEFCDEVNGYVLPNSFGYCVRIQGVHVVSREKSSFVDRLDMLRHISSCLVGESASNSCRITIQLSCIGLDIWIGSHHGGLRLFNHEVLCWRARRWFHLLSSSLRVSPSLRALRPVPITPSPCLPIRSFVV